MMGVKSIIFEINDHFLIVNLGDECEILYNNISIKIDKDKAFFPYNFEEVERLNVRLMGEVLSE